MKTNKITLILISLIFFNQITPIMAQDLVWANKMGGPSYDIGVAIVVDKSGNVYTTGQFWGTADFDPGFGIYNLTSAGNKDIFISKTDASGNFVWAKNIGGIYPEDGLSIALDDSGNVYTTGNFVGTVDFNPGVGTYNLTSSGNFDVFICKLDASGTFVWAKSMGGSTNYDFAFSIAIDGFGNVYTTGFFSDIADFDPGPGTFNLTSDSNSDVFISKLDASGNFVWAKQIGGPGWQKGHAIALDNSGNVYITGQFEDTVDFDPGAGIYNLTSAGAVDIFICKLDDSGNFVWAKQIGGSSFDYPFSLAIDGFGNVYTTGNFRDTVDFDPGAGTYILSWAGGLDIFISKLNAAGDFVWAKSMGGTSDDEGFSLVLDGGGNVYTTGGFKGIADFDPGTGTYNLTSAGDKDIFISKLDALGNFVWAKSMGGTDLDVAYSLALDSSENVYTTGEFWGTADFDPGAGTYNLTSTGDWDIFVHKMNQIITDINDDHDRVFKIYPNPSTGNFIIITEHVGKNFMITDYIGKVITQSTIDKTETVIDLSKNPSGLYFLSIEGSVYKLVKQ